MGTYSNVAVTFKYLQIFKIPHPLILPPPTIPTRPFMSRSSQECLFIEDFVQLRIIEGACTM